MLHHIRRVLRRRYDTLTLESAPLHTERPAWAAQAPAQVDAACKRGADVIGFTEVHGHLANELASVAAKNGYAFFHGTGDVAVAYKMTLDAKASNVPVPGSPSSIVKVEFDFHGHPTTVLALHWQTVRASHMAARESATATVIAEAHKASHAGGLAFYLADSNPDGPLFDPTTEPRAALDKAGLPLVYETPGIGFPPGIGVTTIGHAKADGKVKVKAVQTFDRLGSDHIPAKATFRVAR